MKINQVSSALFLIISFTVFIACKSQPEPVVQIQEVPVVVTETLIPVTPAFLGRLRGSMSNEEFNLNIGRYPFLLSGRVSIEREYTRQSHDIEGGQVRLVDEYIREIITFHEQTPGVAMRIEYGLGNEIIISIAFDNNIESQLRFSAPASDPDSFFHLVYEPDRRAALFSDEKGFIWYGGDEYKLRYSGERSPSLFIKLSQRDVDLFYTRIVPGRRVN